MVCKLVANQAINVSELNLFGAIIEPQDYFLNIQVQSCSVKNGHFRNGLATVIKSQRPNASLTVSDTEFFNFSLGSSDYGVIFVTNGELLLHNLSFRSIATATYGAAVTLSTGATGLLVNCSRFIDCSTRSTARGGAIQIFSGNTPWVQVRGSTFQNCVGGGLDISQTLPEMLVVNTTFSACTRAAGGALSIRGRATVESCSFLNCSTSEYGGAIELDDGALELVLKSSTFLHCRSLLGGAIHTFDVNNASSVPTVSVSNTTFLGCVASGRAGSIWMNGNWTLDCCSFVDSDGTAVYSVGRSSAIIRNCSFLRCYGNSRASGLVLALTLSVLPEQRAWHSVAFVCLVCGKLHCAASPTFGRHCGNNSGGCVSS
jgi:hypothetical protein